jgi:hypothetical protein
MHIGVPVKYLLSLSDFNENINFSTDLQEALNIKFHKDLSSGSLIHVDGWTDRRDEPNSHI